jgi:hypothetical protein
VASDAWEELRRLVVDDPGVRDRLLACGDRDEFVARLVQVADRHGIELSPELVVGELRATRASWFERWV